MKRVVFYVTIPTLVLCILAGCHSLKYYATADGLERLVSLKGEPYILVDARTPGEYASGHIPTAVNIPVTTITKNLPAADRSTLIIVYCQSGGRSEAAKATLDGMGFTRVVDYGSVLSWKGPLIKGYEPE